MHTLSRHPSGGLIFLVALVMMASGTSAAGTAQVTEPDSEDMIISTGSVRLAGTLIMPASPPPYPVVVVVHGASPNTRAPLRNYATNVFARNGIAALIYDKRGTGESDGDLGRASLVDLASDVRAVVSYLKSRDDIEPDAIGLVGDSQAGWIIPLAAAGNPDVAFLAMISASGVSPAQQEAYSITRKIIDSGLGTRLADTGRKGRKLLEDYGLNVRQGRLPAPPIFHASSLVNLNLAYDPVPTLQQITQPVLIVLGEADAQVPAAHSAAVIEQALNIAGNRDYTIRIYNDADHGIQLATGAGTAEKQYAPGYRDGLIAWVTARALSQTGIRPVVDPGAQQDSASFGPDGIYGPLAWYGRASVQIPFLLVGILGFSFTLCTLAVQTIRRRFRAVRTPAERWVQRLAVFNSLLYLVTLLGLIGLVGVLLEGGRPLTLPLILYALPVLAVISVGSCVVLLAMLLRWRKRLASSRWWSLYTTVALLAVAFVPFFGYWNLLGLTL